jgi:sugar phosphate isomerase/epimerase
MTTLARRSFLAAGAMAPLLSQARSGAAAVTAPGAAPARYRTSLAAYSLRKYLDLKKPTMKLDEFIDKAAGWGCDGVELTEYYFEKPITAAYVMRLKRKAIRAGLDVTGTPIGNSFTLPPGAARDKQIAQVKAWIDVSADLGSPAIRIFAGSAPKGTPEPQARKWAAECIEACGEHAGKRGVFLALENHGGVVATADGLLDIVKAVKAEWFAVNLDSGNFDSADPYAEIARCAPYAVTCQVKAELKRQGKKEPMDYQRVADIMRKAGYRGYLTLEYEAEEEPLTAIPRHLEALRKAAG